MSAILWLQRNKEIGLGLTRARKRRERHSPVVVVAGPEGSQVGVVGRGRVRHRSFAPGVEVAKVEAQPLQLVRGEAVVVEQQVVVGRPRGSLKVQR